MYSVKGKQNQSAVRVKTGGREHVPKKIAKKSCTKRESFKVVCKLLSTCVTMELRNETAQTYVAKLFPGRTLTSICFALCSVRVLEAGRGGGVAS